MENKTPLHIAQQIVRGSYLNINKNFDTTSSIYKFTNEDITSYFHHLENKKEVLTVIGSGGQIINSILAGTKSIDCFDISIFPEYYLYLQLASLLTLSKEDYFKYYFSYDKEELFGDFFYEKIRFNLKGKYKEFWDSLYMFNEGIDIYESLLFRQDIYIKNNVINLNPYLQENNYEKIKHILKTTNIKINPNLTDITKTKITKEYDLINLSNILSYHFNKNSLKELINYLNTNFSLTKNGEIINYIFNISNETIETLNTLLQLNGYIENKKILVYKK